MQILMIASVGATWKYLTNSREYYYSSIDPNKPPKDSKIVWEKENKPIFQAWDNVDDLEPLFFYCNPLIELLIIMVVYKKEVAYYFITLCAFGMFHFIRIWKKRVDSDQKLHQKELD